MGEALDGRAPPREAPLPGEQGTGDGVGEGGRKGTPKNQVLLACMVFAGVAGATTLPPHPMKFASDAHPTLQFFLLAIEDIHNTMLGSLQFVSLCVQFSFYFVFIFRKSSSRPAVHFITNAVRCMKSLWFTS